MRAKKVLKRPTKPPKLRYLSRFETSTAHTQGIDRKEASLLGPTKSRMASNLAVLGSRPKMSRLAQLAQVGAQLGPSAAQLGHVGMQVGLDRRKPNNAPTYAVLGVT